MNLIRNQTNLKNLDVKNAKRRKTIKRLRNLKKRGKRKKKRKDKGELYLKVPIDLLYFRILEEKKKKEEEENRIIIDEPIQEKALRTLVTAIKMIGEIKRAPDLSAYADHPKLGPKYDHNFKAKLT